MSTPNAELAYRVLDHIDAHPEQHEQHVWIARHHCGTAACFAGWACLLAGDLPDYDGDDDEGAETSEVQINDGRAVDWIPRRAGQLLRMPEDDGPEGVGRFRLFATGNSREDIGRLVEEIFGPRPAVTE